MKNSATTTPLLPLLALFSCLAATTRADTPELVSGPPIPANLAEMPLRPDIAALLAPDRWSAPELARTLGEPGHITDGEHWWLLNEQLLKVAFDAQGLPLFAQTMRAFDPAKRPPGFPPPNPAALASALGRFVLAVTAPDSDPLATLGRPSHFLDLPQNYDTTPAPRWHFRTRDSHVAVSIDIAKRLEVQWSSASRRPDEGPTTDGPLPAGPWRLRPPPGQRSTTTFASIHDFFPLGLAPRIAFDTVVARLGPPLSSNRWGPIWPGLELHFNADGLVQVKLDTDILLTTPNDPQTRVIADALMHRRPQAVFGIPTFQKSFGRPDVMQWRFEGPGGVIEIAYRGGKELTWTFGHTTPPAESCAWLSLPAEATRSPANARRWSLAAPWFKTSPPPAKPRCGWPIPTPSRYPRLANDPDRLVIDPVEADAVRAAYPNDPVARSMGEPAAVWVRTFGPPTRQFGATLAWDFDARVEDKARPFTALAADTNGDGRIDTFRLERLTDDLKSLTNHATGLDLLDPANSLARFGKPDAPNTWRAGVRFDPATGVLTLASPNMVELARWLRTRSISGPLVDALGQPLLEVVERIRWHSDANVRFDGEAFRMTRKWTLPAVESGAPEFSIMWTCKGSNHTCDRVDIGPAPALEKLF